MRAGLFQPNWEVPDMTTIAEVESKYGRVVRSADRQMFCIEGDGIVGRQEEKLTIGMPDSFAKTSQTYLKFHA
jgi:hypothetical protein